MNGLKDIRLRRKFSMESEIEFSVIEVHYIVLTKTVGISIENKLWFQHQKNTFGLE